MNVQQNCGSANAYDNLCPIRTHSLCDQVMWIESVCINWVKQISWCRDQYILVSQTTHLTLSPYLVLFIFKTSIYDHLKDN